MAFLRRALQLFAIVWGASGLAIAFVPRWILVTWFEQVPYPDYTYVRICGIAAVVLGGAGVDRSRAASTTSGGGPGRSSSRRA